MWRKHEAAAAGCPQKYQNKMTRKEEVTVSQAAAAAAATAATSTDVATAAV